MLLSLKTDSLPLPPPHNRAEGLLYALKYELGELAAQLAESLAVPPAPGSRRTSRRKLALAPAPAGADALSSLLPMFSSRRSSAVAERSLPAREKSGTGPLPSLLWLVLACTTPSHYHIHILRLEQTTDKPSQGSAGPTSTNTTNEKKQGTYKVPLQKRINDAKIIVCQKMKDQQGSTQAKHGTSKER
jgi:hypothetical protein